VVGDVVNGSYDSSSNSLTASSRSSQYDANKMSFTLSGVALTTANIVVKNSDGTTTTSG